MKYTKDFEKWWSAGYGILDDAWCIDYTRARYAIKRIAYRAYRRGKSDMRRKG